MRNSIKFMRSMMSILLFIVSIVVAFPNAYVKAEDNILIREELSIVSDTFIEDENKTSEIIVMKRLDEELCTMIRDIYRNGIVVVTLHEDGQVFHFTNHLAHSMNMTDDQFDIQSEIPIQPKKDMFSTKILTKTAAYIASALASRFTGCKASTVISIASDLLSEVIDENLSHIYYTAYVYQTLVSDGAVSFYRVKVTLMSYKNSARTKNFIHRPTSYFNYESAYPY